MGLDWQQLSLSQKTACFADALTDAWDVLSQHLSAAEAPSWLGCEVHVRAAWLPAGWPAGSSVRNGGHACHQRCTCGGGRHAPAALGQQVSVVLHRACMAGAAGLEGAAAGAAAPRACCPLLPGVPRHRDIRGPAAAGGALALCVAGPPVSVQHQALELAVVESGLQPAASLLAVIPARGR